MNSFEEIHTLALFCLILAVKFTETGNKAFRVVNALKHKLSCDFLGDEFFILKYLNFHLNMLTLYDAVLYLQFKGIVFDIEKVSHKKLLVLYDTINKTTLSIIEHKIVLDIPMQMLAFGIIGFCRRLIGLDALTQELLMFHGCDLSKGDELNECVNKVERCFRVRRVHNSSSLGKGHQKELTAPNTPNTSDSDTIEETNVGKTKGGNCESIINTSCCCSNGNSSSNVFIL